MTIVELPDRIAALPAAIRAAADRIFAVDVTVGTLELPREMEGWAARQFGSVDVVRSQRIVRVTNQVTLEGALFNELRARRPIDARAEAEVRRAVADSLDDPFCRLPTGTPADSFGRTEGRYGMSASNVAKYDGFHGVLVFKEHDPLAPVDGDIVRDHFATARAWARRACDADPSARFYFLMWNVLWRAGGSIVHGHMQMTVTRRAHYPKVEALRRAAAAYHALAGADYFDDLWLVHEALGLGVELGGARAMASLVPVKEREVVVLGRRGEDESALADAVARTVSALRREGMVSHNLALYLPPLAGDRAEWAGFPPLARIVDRGDPAERTSDIGAMELYAASVIASDPFRVADALRA